MNDFGGKLRQARERRGVSLRQIAASTKISVTALEALEHNDISKLPGGIFSRSFVRSYAVEVGLDPEKTVREFLERFYGEPETTGATPARVMEEEGSFESQQRMAGVLLKLVIISVPIVAAILYLTIRHGPAPEADAGQRTVPAAGQPVQTAAPEIPAAVSIQGAAPETSPVAAQPAAMRLELHPTGTCWVTLTIDGSQVFSRLMQAGEREMHSVKDSAVINVGDAGAFAFSIDGRPGRALGEAGQVRTARITRTTLASYVQ